MKPDEESVSDRKTSSAERPAYQKVPRAPRGRKAVYIETLTEARLIQAAAEMGRTPEDMAEAAIREYLHKEASALFEREFASAQHATAITVQRWEFQKLWRVPSWSRGSR